MSNFVNRTGLQYGFLKVVKFHSLNKRKQANWLCRCICGNKKIVFGGNLNSGHTISCGCKKGFLKHGENKIGKRTVEYQTLAGILQRCLNPKSKAYKWYGGVGIRVCDEWNSMKKFSAFLACVGRKPVGKYSLDRWPNKNGNYEPSNVRWATDEQQQGNTNKNIYVTFMGKTLCKRAMARKFKVDPTTFNNRLSKGLNVREALFSKKWKKKNYI